MKNIEYALTMAEGMEKIDDILCPGEDVDDQLVRLAEYGGVIVATTDSELRRRIRQEVPAGRVHEAEALPLNRRHNLVFLFYSRPSGFLYKKPVIPCGLKRPK